MLYIIFDVISVRGGGGASEAPPFLSPFGGGGGRGPVGGDVLAVEDVAAPSAADFSADADAAVDVVPLLAPGEFLAAEALAAFMASARNREDAVLWLDPLSLDAPAAAAAAAPKAEAALDMEGEDEGDDDTGMRAWPFPYGKLMHPFIIGGIVTYFAFSKIQDTMCDAEIYANNPSNPKYAEIQARKHKAEGH
ncbi:hypothetical protein H4217_000666 [Coemansia sp. RSA 1939]|nr:hypothetical protein H4217_000666 [Coemansia sp. RSA 1939]